MSISSTVTRVDYVGDGTDDTFPYPFKIFAASDIEVIEVDDSGVVTTLTQTTDYTVTGVGSSSGGNVVRVAGDLPEDYTWTIRRKRQIKQSTDIRNQGDYYPEVIEDTFDKATMIDQQQQDEIDRSLKISRTIDPVDFDAEIEGEATATFIPRVKQDGSGMEWVDPGTAFADSASGGASVPNGGDQYAVLEKSSAADQDSDWSDAIQYSGHSARFDENFSSDGIKDTLDKIIKITYAKPSVSLAASGSGTLREKGDDVTSSTLTATITKKSDPIKEIRFYKGSTLLDTETTGTAIPDGGSQSYDWTGSFSDNQTFKVEVDDDGTSNSGTSQTVSDTVSFSFVYPYYWGAGTGITESDIEALTKSIIASTSNKTVTFTLSGSNYPIFAYPKSYGALTSVLDANNFETLPDWAQSTVSITGLDGTAVDYYVYKFSNLVAAGDVQWTFKR